MRRNYSYLVIVLLLASVISGIIVPSKNVRGALDSATQQLGSSATSDPIREYPITTHNAGPLAIVASPKGSLWFTEFTAGKIAEFFPLNATFREFQVPQSGAAPASLAIDKNGQVWFSDQSGSGSIWTFNPSIDKFIQYKTPTTNSTPLGVTIDRDNNVWFAELTGNRLGVLMYPTYSLTEFSLPTQNSGPAEMTVQPSSSKIWITETYANKIAEFDITTKSFNEFPSTVSIRSPVGIVLDGAGNVWVSEHGGSSIIIFNPTNSSFRKYPTSVPPTSTGYDISAPATLAIDNQGRLWFVEHFSNKVGRLEPGSGTMEEFVIPTQGAYSVLNALDSAGNFWFTEFSANQIGSIRANATTPVGVSSKPLQTTEVNSGQNTITEFVITNRLATPIEVMMNTSSSFSPTGQTSSAEVALNTTTLNLNPQRSATVRASVTPDSSLSSGPYSIAVGASYGRTSTIAIVTLQVRGSTSLLGPLSQYPAVTLLAIGLLLSVAYFLFRRLVSRKRLSNHELRSIAKILGLGSCVLLALLISTPMLVSPASAKCPGIPTAGSSGPDYLDITFAVVLPLVALGFILFLVVRDALRRREQRKNGAAR